MPVAKLALQIEGGGDIRRALGAITSEVKRANAAMNADERAAVNERKRIENEEIKSARDVLRQKHLERQRAAREATRLERQAQKERERTNRDAERQKTRDSERESQRRARVPYREADEQAKAKKKELTLAQQVEVEKTRALEREARKRARIIAEAAINTANGSVWRMPASNDGGGNPAMGGGQRAYNWRSTFGQLTLNVGQMLHSIATQLHGEIQGARATRAQTEHTLGGAFYQAGASAGDVGAMNRRVYQFAREQGMDSNELAQAANAAQTEFSVFGDSRTSDADRRARVEQFLSNAELARNTYQDVGQVTRVGGLLSQAGITGPAQRQVMLAMTGMAQRGAIELGGVTREAMAPMQMRMANAVNRLQRQNPNASAAQIAHAQQQAVLETMAELEVGRGMGFSPRRMGNVTASMETRLGSNVVQQRMRHNIESFGGLTNQQRTALMGQIFDQSGHMLEGAQSTVGLARAFRAAGIDSTTAQNILAGGGRGNPQGLQANERQILAALIGGEGTVGQLVAGAGRDVTEADVARGKAMVDNEQLTELTRTQETQVTALTDNTSAMVRLSNYIARLLGEHPVGGTVVNAGVGAVGGSLLSRLGTFAIGPAAVPAAPAPAAPAAPASAGGGLARVLGGAGPVAGSGLVGAIVGDKLYRAIDRAANPGGTGLAGNRSDSVFSGSSWNVLANSSWSEIGQGLVRAALMQPGDATARALTRGIAQDDKHGGEKAGLTAAEYEAATRRALESARLNITLNTADLIHAATVASTQHTPAPGPAGQRR